MIYPFKEIHMKDFNTIQLAVGTFGILALAISCAFIVYWFLFAKKHTVVPHQKISTANTVKIRLSNPAVPAFSTAEK